MSIFSFEEKYEKELKKNRTEYEKSLDRSIKKAQLEDAKAEQFFKSEGAKIYLKYLENERDTCLLAMRARPRQEDVIRLQERYAIRCADIASIELYVSRVADLDETT